MTDIEIARNIIPKDITEVAKELGIEDKIELYGKNKAKNKSKTSRKCLI